MSSQDGFYAANNRPTAGGLPPTTYTGTSGDGWRKVVVTAWPAEDRPVEMTWLEQAGVCTYTKGDDSFEVSQDEFDDKWASRLYWSRNTNPGETR